MERVANTTHRIFFDDPQKGVEQLSKEETGLMAFHSS